MTELIAKPVVKNKIWIVESQGNKIGNIMTVDEGGESTIVLLPSCPYNKIVHDTDTECKVGKIIVSNSAGSVTLDKAFEATYVQSATMMPTPPVVINTIEGKINNNLILSKPPEVQRRWCAGTLY